MFEQVMKRFSTISIPLVVLLMMAASALAQDKSTGSIKGKVRVETGSASQIAVIVRQGEREVTQGVTNNKGEFTVSGLRPGRYSVTFRKPGLVVGTVNDVEVKGGKTRSLSDGLFLRVDDSSLALLRGSVFDPAGRSVRGARVELARIESDGSLKKVGDARVTTETGRFMYRLPPDKATYRVTVKAQGAQETTKEIVIDDAVAYNIAVTLEPKQQ